MSTGKSTASPRSEARRRTRGLNGLRWAGMALLFSGGIATAVGAVLPWAQFMVFGVSFVIPGVMGMGALTLVAAAAALLYGRRFPLAAVLAGLCAVGIGLTAKQETGRAIKQRLLGLDRALLPVNDKLMRAGLPPIEPFPFTRRDDHLGPGPQWTLWGGAAIAIGAAGLFSGARLLRSCPRCAATWSPTRIGQVTFCPGCGFRVGPLVACPACRAEVEADDRFCAACAASLPE